MTRKDNMTYNSAPLNDDEKLRNTLRVLFSADSTPLKRQVAHKHLTRTDDPTLGKILLQDLIRGGFAELVLRYAMGDALDALLVQVRTGDVADAQRLLAQTPVDADALADLLAQDLRSLVSNSRVDLQKQAQGTTAATEGLVSGAGGGTVADMVATIFGGEGDTRTDGLTYLKELNSPAAVEPLAAIAEDINRPVVDVLDAIEVLAAYADPAALPALRRVSRGHGEPTVRGAAVVAVVGITGSFDAIEGVVRPWAEQNPRVAEQTLLHFGDETDNDVLLMTMVRRDEPERSRIVAAAALGMSGNTDYALPVADFLHRDSKDALRERWRAMRAVERENPTPLITDMLADGLRERVQQTTLKPATNEDIEQMTPLLWAMVRFGNDRAEQALGGITSNPRVDERVRAAAERALNKLRDRRSE